jgi:hypothetical protein
MRKILPLYLFVVLLNVSAITAVNSLSAFVGMIYRNDLLKQSMSVTYGCDL